MSESEGFDLDLEVARAWTRFQGEVATRLANIEDLQSFVIDVETGLNGEDQVTPYVQFALQEPMVRLEVSSNAYLDDGFRLTADAEAELVALGLTPPTYTLDEVPDEGSSNYFADGALDDADRLSVMAVRVLRRVFGVPHPAFLVGHRLQNRSEKGDDADVVIPGDPDELRRLVDEAIEEAVGHPPIHDEDDDIPIACGSALVWVTVRQDMPAVEMVSWVVVDVAQPGDALFEVNRLNEQTAFVRFALVGDRISARTTLLAHPFSATQLHLLLVHLAEAVDELDEGLAQRVGGRTWTSTGPTVDLRDVDGEDDDLHPALATIIELDTDEDGSVSPDLAARICGWNRDLVLELIADSSRQEISWRESHEEAVFEGNSDEAEACAGELEAWEATTRLLRRALRLIVESPDQPEGPDGS
ncbi:MAG: YbjN domain-containing protein [Acidimicrobiales bacterium]|jgi:hypothetical protein